MAIFNEILAGRFNRMLQKFTGIKGPPPVPQLAGEIMPVIQMFNDVENRYLESWSLFGATFGVAAVAAQVDGVRIRNPVGSNVVAVIEKMTIWESLADNLIVVDFGPMTADLTNLDVAFRMDSRGPQKPNTILSHQNNAPALSQQVYQFPLGIANTPYDLVVQGERSDQIPIFPGDGLQLRTSTVNALLQVGIRWRERALEESERQ